MDSLSGHSSYLLQQLQEQRIQGLLCDCMLVVKGVCFKAHKNVLAAFSCYFRSLFQNSPSQKNDVFNLVIQDVSGIGQVLDYMYTSHLDINQDNVQALLDIAQCLQVSNIQSMCNAFLKPCPPPVDIPSFTLPGMLNSEHDCLLGGSLPQDVDLHCSSESHRPGFNSDLDQHRRIPVSVPSNSSVCDPSSNMQSPFEKQLFHGYKLRNFYSKQYFKQTAIQTNNAASNPGPSPLVLEESHCQLGVGQRDNTPVCPVAAQNSTCTTPAVEKSTDSILTPSDSLNISSSDPGDSLLSKPVRPKKTVYLKKYNYLRSQKALEEMCAESVSKPILTCSIESQQIEPVVQMEVQESSTEALVPNSVDVPEASPERLVPTPSPLEPDEMDAETVRPDPPQHSGHKQYCCDICGKIFKHPSNLELHKRSHTGEKPFQCNICGRNFSQAGNLQTHLRRHSGEKPYICELCGKSFTASGDVQRHKVVHTGEKPHLCDICGRGFNNLSNLKEHKRTHAVDKTFTCDQCGKSFNTHRKLLKHKVRHNGEKPHSCATCGKSFIGSGDLHRHIRSHTGEKPYICSTCGKSFTRSAMLRKHCTNHCKGAPAAPVSDPGSEHGADSKTVSHSKPLSPICEQTFPTGSPHDTQEKPPSPEPAPLSPESNPSSLTELRSLVPHQLLSSSSDHMKLTKAPLSPEPVYGPYDENGTMAVEKDRVPTNRQSVPGADHSPSGSGRTNAGSSRSGEGQFVSSVTLWGLTLITLPNETDMEQ
ncbi:zinc finger and BTB domain-containing protein 49 [Neosynchiropus ocellatus]